jgi:hypothetical protein
LFGKIGEYKLSLREYKLSLCFLSPLRGGRNFTSILGKPPPVQCRSVFSCV